MIINELKDVLFIILGWLFGLLSPGIVSAMRDKREAKIIKAALLTELRELQYRLVLMVYRIESKYGELNREFFRWAQSILVGYGGINSADSLLKTIGPLLKLTNDEMASLTQYARQKSQLNTGLSLKKYSLSLLEANLTSLARFDTILQGRLLEIKIHIGFMNETVDESRYYFRLSFQNGISIENHRIANINMIDSYETYATQAKIVVEIIRKILAKK